MRFWRPLRGRSAGEDHVDLGGDEIRGQRRQPLQVTLRPTGFDDDVFAVNIAVFGKAFSDCVDLIGERSG